MAPIGIGLALSLIGDTTLYTVLPNPEIAAQAGLSLAVVGVILRPEPADPSADQRGFRGGV